jgi:hypothetical protein
MTGSAKQSIGPQAEEWIASSLALPCANASRLSQAMTLLLQGNSQEKKPGSEEPGLRYWPREADTITFQEGLLNTRAAGGGGQMRNPNVQRADSMIRVRALQQAFTPHVRHAGIAGLSSDN